MDYSFLLITAFLLLYENFVFIFYYTFVIKHGGVIIVDIFQTKVFITVKVTKVDALADIYAPISGPVFS